MSAGQDRRRRIRQIDRQSGVCAYCPESIGLGVATWDEVVPRSKGGRRTADNRVLACERCNKRKRNRSVQDFAPGWAPIWWVNQLREARENLKHSLSTLESDDDPDDYE